MHVFSSPSGLFFSPPPRLFSSTIRSPYSICHGSGGHSLPWEFFLMNTGKATLCGPLSLHTVPLTSVLVNTSEPHIYPGLLGATLLPQFPLGQYFLPLNNSFQGYNQITTPMRISTGPAPSAPISTQHFSSQDSRHPLRFFGILRGQAPPSSPMILFRASTTAAV